MNVDNNKEAVSGYDFDVLVIGAGPGGYETAIKSAQLGKKTACIEAKHFGGICLNEGCIPTKTWIKTANMIKEIKESDRFAVKGVRPSAISVDLEALQARRTDIVNQLTGGVQMLLRKNKCTIIQGHASFADNHTVKVNDSLVTAQNIIIATGSNTFMPPFIAVEGENNLITSKEALELNKLPESMVIIGGGVIGIEFAYAFSSLGCKITVLELMDNILPMVDEEVSSMVKKRLVKDGIEIINGAKCSRIKNNTVFYDLHGEEKSVDAKAVLMAVGRVPNTNGLNAEGIGIEFDKKTIKTDKYLRTNIENIYCIGDANGKYMLAHTASHEGFVALSNIDGKNIEMNYDQIPSCIFVNPEIACIGMTEKQAIASGYEISVGKFPMRGNGKSLVEGDVSGIAKVIIDKNSSKILGVHLYGLHVSDMIGEAAVAMKTGAKADEIFEAVHPHPTISEVIPEAFMAAVNGKSINM